MLDCNFHLIIGGDFNYVDNPVLDKIFPSGKPSRDEDNAVRKIFDEFKVVYGLTDVFRLFYSTVESITFYSKIHKSCSRLDRFYVNNSMLGSIIATEHVNVLWADHKAVKCTVRLGSNPRGPGYWKCYVSVFEDKFFNDDLVALWATLDKGNKR
jgi:exonuclease III